MFAGLVRRRVAAARTAYAMNGGAVLAPTITIRIRENGIWITGRRSGPKEITDGLMRQAVDVRLNKMVFDYDQLIVCGPTFPHEVVGFSGGNKYFFPGIGGDEVINFSHWLGAVITSWKVIGTKYTPVRQVIDRAAGSRLTKRYAAIHAASGLRP